MNKKLFLCAALIISYSTTTMPSFDTIKGIANRYQLNIFSALCVMGGVFLQERKVDQELATLGIISFAGTDLYRSLALHIGNFFSQKETAINEDSSSANTSMLTMRDYAPSVFAFTTGTATAAYLYCNGYLK